MTIALPGSIISKYASTQFILNSALTQSIPFSAQSPDQKIALAGHIARALAVFCVDEIVIFDDGQSNARPNLHEGDPYTGYSDPNYFMMHVLSYLETPPNLRKMLFPIHPDLKAAGTLPSLDMPHHLRVHEWCQYREGVTMAGSLRAPVEEQGRKKKAANPESAETLVDCGLPDKVSVPASIPPNTRVTLKFSKITTSSDLQSPSLSAAAVAPSAPREEAGYYWGYTIRPASSLSTVFTEAPFSGGYDLTFGTSERGVPISSLTSSKGSDKSPIPDFGHMLIVFGGVAGLEAAVKFDEELKGIGVVEPEGLFDYWIDLCPCQGSRTIRTEEAVWLGLMGLRDVVLSKGRKKR